MAVACVVAALVVGDLARAPDRQFLAAAAVTAIHAYQLTLSPIVARTGVRCHFSPTCSHYAEASIRRHGLVAGGWLAVRRVVRCGPWTPMGTVDLPR